MSLIVGGLIVDIACLSSPMDDVRKRLGRNVSRLRKDAGMSQETFADHAGIHRTYASDIERGARNPTILVVERLAKALGVTPGNLLE
jgi:transcriptional regulator with XRE-family HTH domain